MNLTRQQELKLIELGLTTLINQLTGKEKPKVKRASKKKVRRWSKQQREKFTKTMKNVWRKKHGQTL